MQIEFFLASLMNLALNLVYTVIALLVGVLALQWIDKRLMKAIDFEQELKQGNVAVAIFASSILIFVALIVTFGFQG